MQTVVCVFLLCIVVACAGTPPSEKSSAVAEAPTTAEATMPPAPSVAAVIPPERVVVDGNLDEWGEALAPGRIAFALSPTGAYVAASSDATGFWLGVRGPPAQVPPVGEYTQVAGSAVDPEMGIVIPECTAPDDSKCVATKKKIAQDARAYERRFERWYRIERDRVRVLDSSGSLAAIEGASVAFRASEKGGALEVALPLVALPRFAQAPIATLGLAVRVAESAPALEDKEWLAAELDKPVAFEPLAKLRALAFEDSEWLSYQPGLPLEVEATRYPSPKDRSRFVIQKEPLYAKQLVVGDVEVGYLAAGSPAEVLDRYGVSDRLRFAVVPKNGAPVALPIKGVPLVLMERAGEVHAVFLSTSEQLAHDGSPNASFVPVTSAVLSGVIVSADGKQRELGFDDIPYPYWEDVEPFQGKDTLGLRGHASEWRQGIGKKGDVIELTWRWDAKRATYVGKRTKGRSSRPRRASQSATSRAGDPWVSFPRSMIGEHSNVSASDDVSSDDAVLSSLLASVRLNAAMMFCVKKAGVWELHAPEARHIAPRILHKPADLVSYHLVTGGSCWAGLTGEEPEELSAGDVLLIPHGHAYTLASTADAARRGGHAVDTTFFEQMSAGLLAPLLVDDPNAGAENASFVCGFLGCDANPTHPVLAALPPVLHSRRHDGKDDPLELLVRFAVRQLLDAHAGNQVVLLRLAELMFVEVLRRHFGELARLNRERGGDRDGGTEMAPSWLRGLMDPVVGKMLVSIHTTPERPWTLELLGREAGASRSIAAERFVTVIGRPPMQYLMAWRVALAKQMLAEPKNKLNAISAAVGYASEAAFSRAFKSVVGVSPAIWRKTREAPDES